VVVDQRVERKLSAIPSTDVAGFSRVVGIDEERTLANLKELRRPRLIIADRSSRLQATGTTLVQFASVVDEGLRRAGLPE
jgi:adenylate cyclase